MYDWRTVSSSQTLDAWLKAFNSYSQSTRDAILKDMTLLLLEYKNSEAQTDFFNTSTSRETFKKKKERLRRRLSG